VIEDAGDVGGVEIADADEVARHAATIYQLVLVWRHVAADRRGEVIGGRFRLDERIGKGAMAEVFRAVDLTALPSGSAAGSGQARPVDDSTSAYVAVKILKRQLAGEHEARERFIREGDVQARLRHRNIAALLATGITDRGEPYLVVELLRGKTIRGVVKDEGRLAPRRAASYAWQALHGLAAVHAAGVLHRDLKPANIMLEPSPGPIERVVLIDFGFASIEGGLTGRMQKLTLAGTVVGSLRYMAPERLRGEATDCRSDLYAIGIILYEMLIGQPPFVAERDFDLVEMHLNVEPPSLCAADPSLPAALDEVLAIALAKHQDDRYATADDMAAALDAAAQAL
jgi:serine/threonine-protein kinase